MFHLPSNAVKLTSRSILLLFFLLSLSSPALSRDRPFDRAANWGGTGLLEIPSARILDDGVIRAGIAQALPFRWYTLGMGIYPGVEFSGRLTQVTNIAPDFPGQATLKVAFEHREPEKAKNIVEYFLIQTSETMREVVLKDAAENMRFLNEQLEKATDPLLRAKIYDMLAKEIEKDTFARAQTYYGFYVLDPPVAPDPDKKARPKRALICILSVVVAFFVAVFLAFFLESVNRMKTDDPDRYRQLKAGMKLRQQ
jgi:hypothetical protein